MYELEFVEIGIIRKAIELAVEKEHINRETAERCEHLIMKMQKLDEVFNFTDKTHYIWIEK